MARICDIFRPEPKKHVFVIKMNDAVMAVVNGTREQANSLLLQMRVDYHDRNRSNFWPLCKGCGTTWDTYLGRCYWHLDEVEYHVFDTPTDLPLS